jgi:hypothetical protein
MFWKKKGAEEPRPPLKQWLPAVAVGWLVPGGGHFLLRRYGRGSLLAAAVTSMYLFGLMTRGALFTPQVGDLFTTIIYCGGFFGNVASGLLYFLSVCFGYHQPDMPGMVHDYGTKFLVTAGLLNVLALVDAYEIAVGKKS